MRRVWWPCGGAVNHAPAGTRAGGFAGLKGCVIIDPDKMVVKVEDITYIASGREVLSGASLEVRDGELLSVMGMSGSGKSTLLKCIAGLLRPIGGRILLDGTDIARMSERQLTSVRRQLGMVFQYAALFDSMTVYENVAFGVVRQNRGIRRQELDRVVAENLRLVGLQGVERLMPSQLSGGMQKRVGLARALATKPKLLLFDEPTSGLDPITAGVIDDLIVRLKSELGVTSIVVSHNLSSIFRISDRVAMLHGGRIVACGSPDEMRESSDPVVRQFVEGRAVGPISSAV
ncbi:MAG: ABC transporter ATP-binding protein [Armatimonadota bacterium]